MNLQELEASLRINAEGARQMTMNEDNTPIIKSYFLGKMDAFNVAANQIYLLMLQNDIH